LVRFGFLFWFFVTMVSPKDSSIPIKNLAGNSSIASIEVSKNNIFLLESIFHSIESSFRLHAFELDQKGNLKSKDALGEFKNCNQKMFVFQNKLILQCQDKILSFNFKMGKLSLESNFSNPIHSNLQYFRTFEKSKSKEYLISNFEGKVKVLDIDKNNNLFIKEEFNLDPEEQILSYSPDTSPGLITIKNIYEDLKDSNSIPKFKAYQITSFLFDSGRWKQSQFIELQDACCVFDSYRFQDQILFHDFELQNLFLLEATPTQLKILDKLPTERYSKLKPLTPKYLSFSMTNNDSPKEIKVLTLNIKNHKINTLAKYKFSQMEFGHAQVSKNSIYLANPKEGLRILNLQ
jgi:hypothetical protein